jgi:hypothetical protein
MSPIFTDTAGSILSVGQGAGCSSTKLCLIPISQDISMSRDNVAALQLRSLEAIQAVFNYLSKIDLFSLWHLVLPKSSQSPYMVSFCDLLLTSVNHRAKILNLINTFVNKAGTFFAYVGKKGSTTSFMPMYHSLALALEESHKIIIETIESSCDFSFITAASRTLSILMKKSPYEKLDTSLVPRILHLSKYLINVENPVSQIAGLNLYMTLLSLNLDEAVIPTATTNDGYLLLLQVAYPKHGITAH